MEKKPKILIITQNINLSEDWGKVLSSVGEIAETAKDSAQSLKKLKEKNFDTVIIDGQIQDIPCERLIKKIRSRYPKLDILVGVEKDKEELSERAFSCGADEVFETPVKKEELSLKVKKLFREKNFLESCGLVGKSEELKKIAEAVLRVAPTNITVLITGESGTGKELVAKAIHQNSKRKDKPFVVANCGALAEGVLESELFGHEKGAFTGAISQRKGLFETADGGTIFLDEIGEISPFIQVKLLRVLEEKSFMRVGGSKDIKVDTRVITATNRNLEQEVALGRFRSDLYFRLCVVKIDVPPLRERKKDIPILVYDIINLLNLSSERKILGISDQALDILLRYHWPGNVRELKNFLESMQVFAPGRKIEATDVRNYVDKQMETNRRLPVVTGRSVETAEHELIYQAILSLRNEIINLKQAITDQQKLKPEYRVDIEESKWSDDFKTKPVRSGEVPNLLSMEEMEKELIEKTLKQTSGNRKKTAKILGIGERTLYRKIDKYNLR